MADRVNTNIRFYLPNDPYFYKVDNLPLKDLVGNDEVLQFQVDQLKAQLDELSGRSSFGELKPFTDEASPGYVFVNPGNFIARVNTPSSREVGLKERLSKGVHVEANKNVVATDDPLYGLNSPSSVGGVARTALIRLHEINGAIPSVSVPQFTVDSYPEGNNTDNKTPAYRLDLVFVEAYPAEDQDNGKPRIGIIRGGYFLNSTTAPAARQKGNRFADPASGGGPELLARTTMQQSKDVSGAVISEKTGNISGQSDVLKYTSVPLVEDLKNYIFKPSTELVNIPTFNESADDIPTEEQLAAWATQQVETRGVFCLPIAYVLTPFGHLEGSHIPTTNIMDIRPFFRTAEMTFDERQAVAGSFQPSLTNRFLTRKDPDYLHTRNNLVKGLSNTGPGNLEGRMRKTEALVTGGLRNNIYQVQPIFNYLGTRGVGGTTNNTPNVVTGRYMAHINFHLWEQSGAVDGFLRFEAFGGTTGTQLGILELQTYSNANIDKFDESFGAVCMLVTVPSGEDNQGIYLTAKVILHGGNSTTNMVIGINTSYLVLTNEIA